jgi:hypothetical protein
MQQRLDEAIKQFLNKPEHPAVILSGMYPTAPRQVARLTKMEEKTNVSTIPLNPTDQAIKDQIGVNPLEALPSNPDIAQALANYATEGSKLSALLNANLIGIYMVGFNNYQNEVLAGKIQPPPATTPPQPPAGYAAVKASDGWTWVIPTTDPVCAVPTVQTPPTPGPPGVVAIGSRIATTNFWAALPQDTASGHFTTPTPTTTQDGVTGFFTKIPSPFGGWWEKVG